MAYSDLIRESYPALIGLVDRSDGGNDNDVKFKELKIDIRSALTAVENNLQVGNIGDGTVTAAKLGAVTDGSTVDQLGSGNKIQVKALGITASQIAAATITAAKLATITDGSTVDQNASGGRIQVKDGGVATNQLATGAVTKAKTKMFVSTERTATGAAENIAHGLATIPAMVFVSITDSTAAVVGGYTITEGAHDGTNIILTITNNVKYKVMCWA